LSKRSTATARSVLNDLSGEGDRLDLLRWFEAVDNKGIDEINVYFDRFDGFDV